MKNTRKATRNREYTANFVFFLNVSLHSTVASVPASLHLSLPTQYEDTTSSRYNRVNPKRRFAPFLFRNGLKSQGKCVCPKW
ncbi:hypothetical protein KY290_033213 [Solanum tuberosum]|uniref:Secreted protein n=1 Tax=Solanum tuberosum TaxID=4113 RepID=A0ABQ7TZW8_SOLTU|nr:hypothetical protein KY285_032469 [Solanum tuberosum]KAH0740170.1 hypothetical protein KY290_033213 [Solanum tuberosum]